MRGLVDIEALIRKAAPLVEQNRGEYTSRQRTFKENREDKLLFFGKIYDIDINRKGEKYDISLEENRIRLNMPKSVATKDLEYEYLKKWIKNRLVEILHHYLAIYQRIMKVSIGKIYVKNHKARWASYSPRHNINFNIRLAALPENITEYIVVHELAHALEPNHSRKFWYIVENFCPDYKERRNELTRLSFIVSKNKIWQKMVAS